MPLKPFLKSFSGHVLSKLFFLAQPIWILSKFAQSRLFWQIYCCHFLLHGCCCISVQLRSVLSSCILKCINYLALQWNTVQCSLLLYKISQCSKLHLCEAALSTVQWHCLHIHKCMKYKAAQCTVLKFSALYVKYGAQQCRALNCSETYVSALQSTV